MAYTATDFVNKYTGKAIDDDGAYGVQCVDGFRVFCRYIGVTPFITKNGWADGYWKFGNEHSADFEMITGYKNFRDGDWVVWDRGSKSHPSSHIAMYYQGKEFGENQGGDRGFCLKSTDFTDALGALRPKKLTVVSHTTGAIPAKITNVKVGDSVRIANGATDLNTKKTYAKIVYSTVYKVMQVAGTRVVFGTAKGTVIGATYCNNCTVVNVPLNTPAPKKLGVGSSVKIVSGAKDLNTKKPYLAKVYKTVYKVKQIVGNRVVFADKKGTVIGAVEKKNCVVM